MWMILSDPVQKLRIKLKNYETRRIPKIKKKLYDGQLGIGDMFDHCDSVCYILYFNPFNIKYMFDLFKKRKKISTGISPIEEIPLKTKVREDMDNGTFLKGYDEVKNLRFKDLEITESKTSGSDNFRFTDEDIEIMKNLSIENQTGYVSYSDYLADSISNSISYGGSVSSPLGNLSSGTIKIDGFVDPFSDYPAVMFDTDEIINDPNLVSIGKSSKTGQHIYRYLGKGSKDLDNIGIPFSELI